MLASCGESALWWRGGVRGQRFEGEADGAVVAEQDLEKIILTSFRMEGGEDRELDVC